MHIYLNITELQLATMYNIITEIAKIITTRSMVSHLTSDYAIPMTCLYNQHESSTSYSVTQKHYKLIIPGTSL